VIGVLFLLNTLIALGAHPLRPKHKLTSDPSNQLRHSVASSKMLILYRHVGRRGIMTTVYAKLQLTRLACPTDYAAPALAEPFHIFQFPGGAGGRRQTGKERLVQLRLMVRERRLAAAVRDGLGMSQFVARRNMIFPSIHPSIRSLVRSLVHPVRPSSQPRRPYTAPTTPLFPFHWHMKTRMQTETINAIHSAHMTVTRVSK